MWRAWLATVPVISDAFTVGITMSCTGPALDAVAYRCSVQEDCGAGWYCIEGVCSSTWFDPDTTLPADASQPPDANEPVDTTPPADTSQPQDSNDPVDTAPPPEATITAPPGYQRILAAGKTFTMGSPPEEWDQISPEIQLEVEHQVTLTHSYWLKATEVTQAEWREVMGTSPSHFTGCGDTCPVESVSWFDAVEYVNTLSDRAGLPRCYDYDGRVFAGLECLGYRLPTEAEWEFAARAGTTTATYEGNLSPAVYDCSTAQANLDGIAWWCRNSDATTHPVGTKRPNDLGLYDMLGNVWEWVHDWHDDYTGDATGPTGPLMGVERVIRGGGWGNDGQVVRAAFRYGNYPDLQLDDLGFRPARSMP